LFAEVRRAAATAACADWVRSRRGGWCVGRSRCGGWRSPPRGAPRRGGPLPPRSPGYRTPGRRPSSRRADSGVRSLPRAVSRTTHRRVLILSAEARVLETA